MGCRSLVHHKKKEIDVRSPPPALRLATATPPCVRSIASLATGIASSPARNSSARDHGGAMRVGGVVAKLGTALLDLSVCVDGSGEDEAYTEH